MGKSQYTLCCELWFAGLCLPHGHTLPVKDLRHVLSHIIASISPRKLCLQQSGWNIDNAYHRDTCVTKLWENMQSNFWLTKVYWIEHANVFVTGKNISNLSTTMNSELVRLSEWTNVNKLSLNMKKTSICYFAPKPQCAIKWYRTYRTELWNYRKKWSILNFLCTYR